MTRRTKPERYASWWNWQVAVYRGDDMVDAGSLREVAEARGVNKATILFHLMPSGRRRADRALKQDRVLRVVRVDEDDEATR